MNGSCNTLVSQLLTRLLKHALCKTDQDLLCVANPPSEVAHVSISLDNLRCKFYAEPAFQSVLDMSSHMAIERMISSLHLMYSIHHPLCIFTVTLDQTSK